MISRQALGAWLAVVFAISVALMFSGAGSANQSVPLSDLEPDSLRVWLSYLASDDLEGRATFSEGLGLAASYIAQQLRDAGVQPGGDSGTYFQQVAVTGVQSTNLSSLTVDVNGQSRTFRDGEGVTFSRNVGGKRILVLNDVEFVGYGLNMGPGRNDYENRDVRNKAVVWIGQSGPASADQQLVRSLAPNRPSIAIEEMGAAAALSQSPAGGRGGGGRGAAGRGGNAADFTTTQRLDLPRAPSVTLSDEVLEFLFSASDLNYLDLKVKGDQGQPLPAASLKNVTLTFNIDATYRVVSTQFTRNVIGIIEGADANLKTTYVAFGSHYDHLGSGSPLCTPRAGDSICNGADDDGSGSAALIGLARTFAAAPKPRRSLLFAWHAGEELGLYGSRFLADHPPVPMESIVAQLNIDMIGRNKDDDPLRENSVYAVGADRISTEVHNLLIDANSSLATPMDIDFEMNDPWDPERIYFRSDHFSYASKGIPVIFFFTGLHRDYHQVSDSVEKIHFTKMARISRLIYETGRRIAELDHAPARDMKGPRFGKGSSGRIE